MHILELREPSQHFVSQAVKIMIETSPTNASSIINKDFEKLGSSSGIWDFVFKKDCQVHLLYIYPSLVGVLFENRPALYFCKYKENKKKE